jgi:hypothetical protein
VSFSHAVSHPGNSGSATPTRMTWTRPPTACASPRAQMPTRGPPSAKAGRAQRVRGSQTGKPAYSRWAAHSIQPAHLTVSVGSLQETPIIKLPSSECAGRRCSRPERRRLRLWRAIVRVPSARGLSMDGFWFQRSAEPRREKKDVSRKSANAWQDVLRPRVRCSSDVEADTGS